MPNLLVMFNHTFTLRQRENARAELGVENILEPPQELRHRWANIPPEAPSLRPWLRPVCEWLTAQAQPGDYVLIQGDFGACYLLVHFAFTHDLIPVYATTERHAREEQLDDGRVRLEHTFEHVRFRRYGD